MPDQQDSCKVCGATSESRTLERCRFCFGYYCPDCAVRFSGRHFCSMACGHGFFSGDEDDDKDPDFEYGDL